VDARPVAPLRRAFRSPFRRRDRDRDRAGGDGLELSPIPTPYLTKAASSQDTTPDLLGELDSRLDAARARLRDSIPPQSDR
jgi:hypothetical protein